MAGWTCRDNDLIEWDGTIKARKIIADELNSNFFNTNSLKVSDTVSAAFIYASNTVSANNSLYSFGTIECESNLQSYGGSSSSIYGFYDINANHDLWAVNNVYVDKDLIGTRFEIASGSTLYGTATGNVGVGVINPGVKFEAAGIVSGAGIISSKTISGAGIVYGANLKAGNGFTGSGAYVNFQISGGIIIQAS